MTKPAYKTVTRTQGNNRALKAGDVTSDAFDFDFEELPVLVHGFRKMVRNLEYDICEMALTTYICARAHGVKFTAIPVFLVRDFHHGALLHNTDMGLKSPKELEGGYVGTNRGYTVTTGVWARSILQDEHDVDLAKITWMLSGDEHVQAYQAPKNVQPIGAGKDMGEMLVSGALKAAIGAKVDAPNVTSMIENPFEAGVKALRTRGLYPINHLVVIKDSVLADNPDLAMQVFEVFAESKRQYVAQLKAGQIKNLTPIDRVHLAALQFMDDPLPYGIEINAQVLEQLIAHAVTQKIIPKSIGVEGLFAPTTHDANG
ncbi:MAG: 4,5-dihydroxyphthalate decarboxylase [Robiginitomaculum sp.]|nr:MAG: 4,5-dihydroxyphthalate decarboxylase [Robiginitomaculum sp.]